MKRLLLALLLAGGPLLHAVVPAASLQVNLTSRDLQNTQGDALGFNIPSWPVLVKSGAVMEFASGSTLKIDPGSTVTGITANAGGTPAQVQYNNAGALGGTTVTWNGTNFTGLANPTNSSDAATKSYVDSAAAGITVRAPVAVASTANLTLSGEQTIDGILTSASRILVKNQASTQLNGIYTTAAGAWSRASDSNTAATLAKGYYYFVSAGTTQGASSWTITTAPVVLNTDPVLFSQFSASQVYSAGTGLSLVGSTFSVNAAQTGVTSLGTLNSLTVTGAIATSAGLTVAGQSTLVGQVDIGLGSGAPSILNLGRNPTANANGVFRFLGSNSAFNWQISHNSYVAGAFEITPSTAGGGSTFSTPTMTFLPAAVTVTGNLAVTAESKTAYGISTGAVAAYDSASGGLYTGYTAGTGIIRSVADNSGTGAPISLQVGNGTEIISVTSAGETLKGVLSFDTNAHIVSTKNNLHVIVNVKDYGAIGNGATNDTASINSAIAALTNFSTLYFPAGKYLITLGGLTAFTSLSNVTIMGDGRSSVLYSSATGSAGSVPFLVLAASCDLMTVRDLALVGSATARGSGGHGLIVYCAHTLVSGMYITGTADFGMYIGSGGSLYNKEVQVVNCISDRTLGDGFHFGPVTDSGLYNCISYFTGDDGCGIGDDGAIGFPATRIEVVGFQSIQAGNHAGGGTHGAGIRIFDGAVDIHVTGGAIYQSCEAGITCGRFSSTTAYNTRIKLDGVKVYQCLQNVGMYGQVNFQFVNQGTITGCWSEAPQSQGCYAFLDCNNLTVTGNTAKDAVLRAFVTDDGTTANVASTWSNWTFSSNVCLGTPSNESYYFIPATGKLISNLLLVGNTETGQSATNYINTNRLSGVCKIVTNVSLGGKSITNGGSGISPTSTPNY